MTPWSRSTPCLVSPTVSSSRSVSPFFSFFFFPLHTTNPPPLFLSIPGFIPSSLISLHPSNPHLFLIGAVERVSDGGISHCVWHQKWMSGRKCGNRQAELMTTTRGRPLEEDWLKICQKTSREESPYWWVDGQMLLFTFFALGRCEVAPRCSDDGSESKSRWKIGLKAERTLINSSNLTKSWRYNLQLQIRPWI